MLGNSLNDSGRKDDAIKDYTKAIEINPQYFQGFFEVDYIINIS